MRRLFRSLFFIVPYLLYLALVFRSSLAHQLSPTPVYALATPIAASALWEAFFDSPPEAFEVTTVRNKRKGDICLAFKEITVSNFQINVQSKVNMKAHFSVQPNVAAACTQNALASRHACCISSH